MKDTHLADKKKLVSDGRRLWEEALQGAPLREADFTTV